MVCLSFNICEYEFEVEQQHKHQGYKLYFFQGEGSQVLINSLSLTALFLDLEEITTDH